MLRVRNGKEKERTEEETKVGTEHRSSVKEK